MIIPGTQDKEIYDDVNSRLLSMAGELDDEQAKLTLAEFLASNPGFTFELMTGIKLFPFQDAVLRAWIKKNFCMNLWSRGASKSWLFSVFCALYPVIEPNTQIVIAAPGFRKSRGILEQADAFINGKNSHLLKQCYPEGLKRKNDEYRLKIGEGYIVSIPLNPAVRGYRTNILGVEEALLVPKEMYFAVLFPFLSSRTGIQKIMEQREMEDRLIKAGVMKEEERHRYKSLKKIILLSSASFEFDFLFELYKEWTEIITGKKIDKDTPEGNYFISQFSWEAIPSEIMDSTMIKQAQSSMSDSMFAREFGARFSKDSSGFFSASKMHSCTVKPSEYPTVELKGSPGDSYILAIDTNLSKSQSADHFSQAVYKINYDAKTITLAHSFAKAGLDFKDYAKYFYYLLTSFPIKYIIYDETGGGGRFIESANEMSLFKDNNVNLKEWGVDFDDVDYAQVLRNAKSKYNLADRKICYGQTFTSETIGKMADTLQTFIDRKRVWFPSPLSSHEGVLALARESVPSFLTEGISNKERFYEDFIDEQDDLVVMTKDETSLIECSVTPLGTRTFNLPQSLRRSDSPTRARKDSFTTLLLATWMAKVAFDLADQKDEEMPVLRPFMM